ncbi:hypothetical protein BofuT4_uP141250.1 [Botrytis cinerea T4]|uniref:Uncharacterized protein n=1 Tax=Botryotinia fuckeliana (strain T4) TaxID=999810 RepID=G2YZ15_BOTF4|nr:hypothetical protein BofuT4_uP141250.1 [Botrytis cinerea T4]
MIRDMELMQTREDFFKIASLLPAAQTHRMKKDSSKHPTSTPTKPKEQTSRIQQSSPQTIVPLSTGYSVTDTTSTVDTH